ncbi:MAG TPA: flagellar FlbD family protein [Clostridia bacterium]|nr:flagellar FlbD family protein [Clostridia bacterium]
MIYVTRLNNEEFVLNDELIEFIEKTPDTVISLTTGKKIVVKETPDEIIQKVIDYKQRIFNSHQKDKEVLK